jgi:hypothetical protein
VLARAATRLTPCKPPDDEKDPDVANCHTHPAEPTAGTCRTCLHEFCDHCLVYSYGRAKPPYCIPCALEAAGVSCAAPPTHDHCS